MVSAHAEEKTALVLQRPGPKSSKLQISKLRRLYEWTYDSLRAYAVYGPPCPHPHTPSTVDQITIVFIRFLPRRYKMEGCGNAVWKYVRKGSSAEQRNRPAPHVAPISV